MTWTPGRHDSVGHILRAGRHLLSLIDEVLAISRIEAGRLSLSLEPVAVGDMARECLHFVSGLAEGRGIVCENRTEDARPRAGTCGPTASGCARCSSTCSPTP